MAGVLPATLRAVASQRSNPPRRICPYSGERSPTTTDKTKGPVFRLSLSFYLMPGSSLLSHGETPHYHRRYGVSLLSSAWGQVGPSRYCRRNFCFIRPLLRSDLICIRLKIFSHPPKQPSLHACRSTLEDPLKNNDRASSNCGM